MAFKKRQMVAKKEADKVTLSCGTYTLCVKSDVEPLTQSYARAGTSPYYMKKFEVPVFEVEINREGSFFTEYSWK